MSAFAWIPDFFLAISQTKVKDSVMWHNFSILLSQALEFVRINSIFDKLELASNDLRAESLNVFEPKLMVINITHILYSSTVDSTHNALVFVYHMSLDEYAKAVNAQEARFIFIE